MVSFVAAEFSIVKVRYSQIQLKAAEGILWQNRQNISSNI
jgi:hypothetical protein